VKEGKRINADMGRISLQPDGKQFRGVIPQRETVDRQEWIRVSEEGPVLDPLNSLLDTDSHDGLIQPRSQKSPAFYTVEHILDASARVPNSPASPALSLPGTGLF
jgi:hypothetical protein